MTSSRSALCVYSKSGTEWLRVRRYILLSQQNLAPRLALSRGRITCRRRALKLTRERFRVDDELVGAWEWRARVAARSRVAQLTRTGGIPVSPWAPDRMCSHETVQALDGEEGTGLVMLVWPTAVLISIILDI